MKSCQPDLTPCHTTVRTGPYTVRVGYAFDRINVRSPSDLRYALERLFADGLRPPQREALKNGSVGLGTRAKARDSRPDDSIFNIVYAFLRTGRQPLAVSA